MTEQSPKPKMLSSKKLRTLTMVIVFLIGIVAGGLLLQYFFPPLVHATFYSQNPGASGNDGYVEASNLNYATCQAAATGTANTNGLYLVVGQASSGSYYVDRAFLLFNTSTIPVGATISSAQLCLDGYEDFSTNDFYVRIVDWTEGSDGISSTDFNGYGTVVYSSDWSTSSYSSAYNNITISNTTLIQRGSITYICLRSSRDISATSPGYPPAKNEYIRISSYDNTGSEPLLEVTYTAGDTTKPTYNTTPGTNSTLANSPIMFYVNCSDETALSGFMLQHNNTGTSANTTWVTFVSLGAGNTWANSTLTSNYTVGNVIQWNLIFNDSSNNWNTTMPWQNTTLTFSASITVQTTTHSWSVLSTQSNVTINEAGQTINFTVTANVNFTIQAKSLNATLINGSNTIALSNLLMSQSVLASAISVTTNYQNVPDLTNQASGTSVAKTLKLWLTVPAGTPTGNYVYTLYIQIIQS
jgi:hypothetical protein